MNVGLAKSLIAGEGLTARQLEILTLMAQGHTYLSAGRTLSIDGDTVRHHVGRAKKVLGAATLAQAVALALQLGWLELEPPVQQRAGSPAPRPPSPATPGWRPQSRGRRRSRADLDV